MFHVFSKYIFIKTGRTRGLLSPCNCRKLIVQGWQEHTAGKLSLLHSSKREEKQRKITRIFFPDLRSDNRAEISIKLY